MVRGQVALIAACAALIVSTIACQPYKSAKPSSTDMSSSSPPSSGAEDAKVNVHPADRGSSDDDLVADAVSRLGRGRLAYSTPEKMKSGETGHVTAKIAGENVSVQVLTSDLAKGKNNVSAVAQTPVSTRMKMTLKSADFDITALSSEEQIVAGDTPTTWEWDIIPKHSGKLNLHLAAIVEIKQISRDFATVDREIAVQVDPVDAAEKFFQTNWQWIIATLTAMCGALWKLWKDRKRNVGGESPLAKP